MICNRIKYYISIILFIVCNIFTAYSENCPKCYGTGEMEVPCKAHCHYGKVSCHSCNGSGVAKERCSYCSSGYVTKEVKKRCSNCSYGKITMTDTASCGSCRNGQRPSTYNGRTVYQTCSVCHGSGTRTVTRKATCPICSGSGYSGTETQREECSKCSYGYVERTCYKCNGEGKVSCRNCYGNGTESRTCNMCYGSGKR